jgi:hypothetical protein
MDDRMLSAIVLGGLSGLFGGYGILTLVAAYRAGNLADWGRLAIMGGVSVILSAVLADVAVTRLMAEPSGTCRDGKCGTQPSSAFGIPGVLRLLADDAEHFRRV